MLAPLPLLPVMLEGRQLPLSPPSTTCCPVLVLPWVRAARQRVAAATRTHTIVAPTSQAKRRPYRCRMPARGLMMPLCGRCGGR